MRREVTRAAAAWSLLAPEEKQVALEIVKELSRASTTGERRRILWFAQRLTRRTIDGKKKRAPLLERFNDDPPLFKLRD